MRPTFWLVLFAILLCLANGAVAQGVEPSSEAIGTQEATSPLGFEARKTPSWLSRLFVSVIQENFLKWRRKSTTYSLGSRMPFGYSLEFLSGVRLEKDAAFQWGCGVSMDGGKPIAVASLTYQIF